MGLGSPLLWQKAYDALDSKNKAVVPLEFATKPEKMIVEVEKYVSMSQGKPIKLPNGENLFVRDVLQKVSRWIKKFVEVGDAAVQYDPGHAALPWALLRLLLQASMNNIEKHAAVLEGIEKIAYYLVWSRIEEAFLAMPFEAHAQLQLDFIQLYATILTFVTRSIRFLHNKPQRIATAFFSSDSKFQKDIEQMAAKKLSIESHVQQIMDQSSLKQWDEVKARLADLRQPLIRIERMVQATSASIDRAETERILDWASEIPFEKHFRTVQRKALDGTGKWLFQDPEFVAWESSSRSQILWLHGSSGSGKSTLISMVIESLIRAHEKQQGPYPIYFFCSRNTAEPERADPEHILRSLMRQASDLPGGPPLHRILKERHEKRRVKGNVSAEEAADILISTIETRPATYIVIDALDECDRQKRDILLGALKTILATSDSLVKIFVTSRDNHYDIALSMDGSPALCIDASRNQKDIEYYVQYSVQRAIDKRKLLPTERMTGDLQQAIVDSLCNGADGMFRWVELQLELLYNIRVRSILLERLKRLPPRLEEIYSELYDYKMQELGEEQAKVVKTILSWLLVAKGPLHTSELCQLISTSEEADMSVQTVLDITFDLVRLDAEQDQLKFSHLSVREFLEKRQAEYGQAILQTIATSACLNFLARVKNINARSYAALYWPFHAEDAIKEGGGAKLQQQLDTFLTKHNSCFETWNNTMLQALKPQPGFYNRPSPTEQRLLQALAKKRNPLLVAACFALSTTLRRIISETDQRIRINLRNCVGESALQLASQYCPVGNVRALLEKDADANTQGGEHGNALCAASFKGYVECVKLLLSNGADVNAIGVTYELGNDRNTSTALYAAASEGHAEIVELLLRHGANVNTKCGVNCNSTALHAASSEGHEGIVKLLLLTKDANVNAQGGEYGSALCAASCKGYLEIVKLLLDKGANVNAAIRNEFSSNALSAASSTGHTEVAKLLLHRGADINAQGGYYGNALCAALSGESRELIDLLLDKGADVNAQGGENGNALCIASGEGYLDITRLLLKRGAGADADASGHALCAASSGGHLEIVKLLLREGISVNAQNGGHDGNALCAAISRGSPELVSLLLDNGADVNAQGGYYGNSLCTAISRGSLELVILLLDKGADVRAQEDEYRNALCTALSKESGEIMDILLDKGADINAQGCNLGNALQAASFTGHLGFVKLLIDRNADVNAPGGDYGNALQAASYKGHTDIVRLLLENGANINAWEALPERSLHDAISDSPYYYSAYEFRKTADSFFGKVTSTALYAAASEGHKEIVELLLGNNADVDPEADAFRERNWLYSGKRVTDTALHAASSKGYINIVELLLSKGVDVNVPGGFRDSYSYPFLAALNGGHQDVSCLLLDAGANFNHHGQHMHGRIRSMLQIAASRGYTRTVNMLLERGADINAEGCEYDNALQAACSGGHQEVVEILLDAGANVNTQAGRNSDALKAASAGGYSDIVRLLLDKGANINAQGDLDGSALHAACASMTEWPDVVEILLHAGADANAQGYMRQLPLTLASAGGHEKVVELLLNAGADVNAPRHKEHEVHDTEESYERGGYEDTALCAASYRGHWEMVRMLLDFGATDNSPEGEEYSKALVAASSQGHVEIVLLLLHMGANVNFQGGDSLQTALFGGHREVAKLLLDKDADVNAQGGRYGSALQAACLSHRDQPEIVEMLLIAGADVNGQGGEYGNALQATCAPGSVRPKVIVRLLLDAGADVNAQGGKYGSTLQAACLLYAERLEIVETLLEAGADVNAQGGEYGNALQAACASPSSAIGPEVVRLLLDAGADINAQGGEYGNALQAACASHSSTKGPEVVRLLLDAGADINAQGGEYGNALQAACASHSSEIGPEVVRLLLNAGADINAQGGKYGTALQAVCASYLRQPEVIVGQLLDAGADINAQGGEYGNALQAALSRGHTEASKLLQSAGAQHLEQQADIDHDVL